MTEETVTITGNQTIGAKSFKYVDGICVNDMLAEMERAHEALGKAIEMWRKMQ